MLTVDDYGRIRRAHRDGMSVRAIARTFHHSRRKIREVLVQSEPRPYTRTKGPPAPKLGPFHAVIDEILATDGQILCRNKQDVLPHLAPLAHRHGRPP